MSPTLLCTNRRGNQNGGLAPSAVSPAILMRNMKSCSQVWVKVIPLMFFYRLLIDG